MGDSRNFGAQRKPSGQAHRTGVLGQAIDDLRSDVDSGFVAAEVEIDNATGRITALEAGPVAGVGLTSTVTLALPAADPLFDAAAALADTDGFTVTLDGKLVASVLGYIGGGGGVIKYDGGIVKFDAGGGGITNIHTATAALAEALQIALNVSYTNMYALDTPKITVAPVDAVATAANIGIAGFTIFAEGATTLVVAAVGGIAALGYTFSAAV
jgi:hypothetical protein